MESIQIQEEKKIESLYPYSVRIEQTAKGARVSVHTYGKGLDETVKEAILAYGEARIRLEDARYKIAPEE
jgi:hypothetical protein